MGGRRRNPAFTLVELCVAIAVLSLLMMLLIMAINQTSRIWKVTSGKIEAFESARAGFDLLTRYLSQATLNTNWEYEYQNGVPYRYTRSSELHFVSGMTADLLQQPPESFPTHGVFFQAPLGFAGNSSAFAGLPNLLNSVGFYLEYGPDTLRPGFIAPQNSKVRPRLKQFLQPSQLLSIYKNKTGYDWFRNELKNNSVNDVAENIVALILLPGRSFANEAVEGELAPHYLYDSRNATRSLTLSQLPPLLQVTIVAIDEGSASLLQSSGKLQNLVPQNSFTTSADYPQDLAAFEKRLVDLKANYRTFSTKVSILASRWSE